MNEKKTKKTNKNKQTKNKTYIYAAYKRPTSDQKNKNKRMERMQVEMKKKAGVTMLMSDKIDFKTIQQENINL